MTGVLNIHKEKGYTSHDVVAIVRKIIRQSTGVKLKVGHTGTLDPDATGVLPICLGRATKLSDHLSSADKTYIAEVILGVETNTGDISGEIIAKNEVNFDKNLVAQAVKSFSGEYMQIPPMYSAIKIGGKKLYDLARQGKSIERLPRPVIIHKIGIQNYSPDINTFTIEVKCSKGTYIRSLATDIGQRLGCGATMGNLIRTQSGIFSIDSAQKLEILENGQIKEFIQPIERLLPYPKIYVTDQELTLAKNGNPLPLSALGIQTYDKFWVADNERLIGLYYNDSTKLRPEVML